MLLAVLMMSRTVPEVLVTTGIDAADPLVAVVSPAGGKWWRLKYR